MWSGTAFYICKIFEKHFIQIDVIKLELKRTFFSYLKGFYLNRLKGKKYVYQYDIGLLKYNFLKHEQSFKNKYDLIITFEFFLVPFLKFKDNRILLWTDATFDNLHNYYEYLTNLSNITIQNASNLQARSLLCADYIFLSSDWAKQSVIKKYNINTSKISVLPFGSNLDTFLNLNEINSIIEERKKNDVVYFFFPSVDWRRKGGELALEVVNKLNFLGIKSRLIVAGCKVPDNFSKENIEELGFLDKTVTKDIETLISIYKRSSYLILPSKADCTPIVFNESNSFALPILSTITGGVPSMINENNGKIFPYEKFVDSAVHFITSNHLNSSFYEKLCINSYNYYIEHLNWGIAENKIVNMFQKNKF